MTIVEEPTTDGTPVPRPPRQLRAVTPEGSLVNVDQIRTLRELRAVVLDLQSFLDGIRSGATLLATYEPYVQKKKTDIQQLMDALPVNKFDAETADSIYHLHNLWDQMSVNPLLLNPGTFGSTGAGGVPQDQLRDLNLLDTACNAMLFQIGVLTIPARVNDWLSLGRSGYYIPFHEVFAPELPVYDDRMRVLKYLAWQPRVVKQGLVDVSTGLIYRYSSKSLVRWVSLLAILLAFVLATGLVYLSTHLPNIEGWPLKPEQTLTMMAAWAALAVGVVVHICITIAKRIQEQPELPPALPVGDIARLADAKLGPTLLKIVLALVGLFGLVLTAGIAQASPFQAFLAGYSLDSVVELFGASAERRASSQVAGLRQQLGVSSEN
jgi:hypothetical protein